MGLRLLKVVSRKGSDESIFRFFSNVYVFETEDVPFMPGTKLPWIQPVTISDAELAELDRSAQRGSPRKRQQERAAGQPAQKAGGNQNPFGAPGQSGGGVTRSQTEPKPHTPRGGGGRKNK